MEQVGAANLERTSIRHSLLARFVVQALDDRAKDAIDAVHIEIDGVIVA